MARTMTAVIMGVSMIALAGCAKTREADIPPGPMGGGGTGTGPSGPGYLPGSQGDFLANTMGDRIFFATNRSDVDDEDRAILQSQAKWMQTYPLVRVVIEGHCDERGTRDYNLALGARRANAAKNYLASLGISPSRIDTISYGKERPDALGSDEESWARNRRSVTITIKG